MSGDTPCENTDRELWRERPGDYYADSIHVTEEGAIGINCGGMVYTMSVKAWHKLAAVPVQPQRCEGLCQLEAGGQRCKECGYAKQVDNLPDGKIPSAP